MPQKQFKIGRVSLKKGNPLIMGVLNVTPDSFSDGGRFFVRGRAVAHALRMESEGADILDIGGESSRPGSTPVSAEEEMRRVIPVIAAIRKKTDIPISIDTVKPAVAFAAVEAGADVINDISGFTNPAMVAVAAKCKKPVIVMHMKGTPRTMQKNPHYGAVVRDVCSFLERQCRTLEKEGVKKIIVDTGIGFGKTPEHNLALLRGLGKVAALGHPVMVGASRKSFIGAITGADTDERLAGTLAAHIWSALHGAAILRVHDVAAHRQALDVLSAIGPP